MEQEVLIVTTPTVPGCRVKRVLGVVHGLVIRTRGLGGKLLASFESLVGGRVRTYASWGQPCADTAGGRAGGK